MSLTQGNICQVDANGSINFGAPTVAGTVEYDGTTASVTTNKTFTIQKDIQTSGNSATVVTGTTILIPASTLMDVDCIVSAVKSGGSDAAKFTLSMSYVRNGSAAPTAIGSVTSTDARSTAGASAWTATIQTDGGNNMQVSVTGQSSTNINWTVILQYRLTQ